MTFYEILGIMGRYDAYIQVGYRGKNSGIMRVGKIPYKKISHYSYKKHVLSITPLYRETQKKRYIFVQLVDD